MTAAAPSRNVILDSFWNLIQTADDDVQRGLYSMLENKFKGHPRRRHPSRGLSDEEMERRLKDFPPLTTEDFPDLTKEDYNRFASTLKITSKVTKTNIKSNPHI